MSESTWKNGKDLIKSKEFYSSVNWDMLSRKPSKSKNETKCECQNNHVLIKTHVTTFHIMLSVRNIEFLPRHVIIKE